MVLIGAQSPEGPIAWRRVARDGAILERGVLGQGKPPQAAPADTVLVLPGSDAQVKALDQPATSEAQARSAAAYLFRGSLATDVADTAYAIGGRGGEDQRLVAAFGGERIRQWLGRCAEAGLHPSAMHLDCALWPTPDRVVRIVQVEGRTIIAGGALGGFTLETELAGALIGPWLKRLSQPPLRVETVGPDAEAPGIDYPGVVHPGVGASALLEDPRDVLARAAADPPAYAPVLRLAEFSGSARKSSARLRPWLLAGVLAVVAILIQAGLATYEGLQDAEASRRAMASAESQFRQLRPDVKRIVNLRAQVSAALNTAQPPRANPVLAAGQSLASVLEAHPDVRLDELRYEAAGGRIGLRLSGAQPALLDAAVADLRARLGGLEVGQQETAEGRVSLAITLEAS